MLRTFAKNGEPPPPFSPEDLQRTFSLRIGGYPREKTTWDLDAISTRFYGKGVRESRDKLPADVWTPLMSWNAVKKVGSLHFSFQVT